MKTYNNSLNERYENIVKDLKFQLTFESKSLNWEYFIKMAEEAKNIQGKKKDK